MSNIGIGKHPGQRAVRWTDDTAQTGEGDKPILRVTFEIDGEEIEWTCWLDSLLKDGKPSANLKGLQALGVTIEDVQQWMSGGGTLEGLDRNEVTLVVEENKNGYPIVKYVNDPREVRQAKPLDRGAKAKVAAQMLGALARFSSKEQEPQQRAPQQRQQQQGQQRPPAKSQRQGAPDYGADDDVPF